jgi:hypothetical protein
MAVERPIQLVNFVAYLTKVFPFRRVTKQLPFIAWLKRMAAFVPRPNFWLIARPLFIVYAALAVSDPSNVVEASFRIWENGPLMLMILDNAKIVYPMMVPAPAKAIRVGWKGGTQNRASSVLKTMGTAVHRCSSISSSLRRKETY